MPRSPRDQRTIDFPGPHGLGPYLANPEVVLMSDETSKIDTLQGTGQLRHEGQTLSTQYYLEVLAQPEGDARRFSGMLSATGDLVLSPGMTVELELEDGQRLQLKVTGSHFSIMGPKQYGVAGHELP